MNETTLSPAPQQTQYSLPSASSLFGWAFSFYRQSWQVIFGISSVLLIPQVIQVVLVKAVPTWLTIVLSILTLVVGVFTPLALIAMVTEGGQPAGGVSGAYGKAFRAFVSFYWIGSLSALATLGGFFLLIIPGMLLSLRLVFSSYIFFDENRKGLSALAESWHYVNGYWKSVAWRLIFIGLVFLLIGLTVTFITFATSSTFIEAIKAGATTQPEFSIFSQFLNLAISDLFMVPMGIIYSYGIYSSLKQIKATTPLEPEEEVKLKKSLTVYSIVGVIGIVLLLALVMFALVEVASKFAPSVPKFNLPTSFQFSPSYMLASAISPLLGLLGLGR